MNAIAISFTAAILAGGAAYAHGSRSVAQQLSAGRLTCTTRPEAGLVFGHTPVADCTFVSSRGGFRQSYAALLSPQRRPRDASVAETIRWDVLTRNGDSRPGMIGGTFTASADRPGISVAAGEVVAGGMAAGGMVALGVPVTLKLVGHSGQRIASFALATPRVAFAAATDTLVR